MDYVTNSTIVGDLENKDTLLTEVNKENFNKVQHFLTCYGSTINYAEWQGRESDNIVFVHFMTELFNTGLIAMYEKDYAVIVSDDLMTNDYVDDVNIKNDKLYLSEIELVKGGFYHLKVSDDKKVEVYKKDFIDFERFNK